RERRDVLARGVGPTGPHELRERLRDRQIMTAGVEGGFFRHHFPVTDFRLLTTRSVRRAGSQPGAPDGRPGGPAVPRRTGEMETFAQVIDVAARWLLVRGYDRGSGVRT